MEEPSGTEPTIAPTSSEEDNLKEHDFLKGQKKEKGKNQQQPDRDL